MQIERLELRRMLTADVEIRFTYPSFFDGSVTLGEATFAQSIGDVNGDGFSDLAASFSTDGPTPTTLAVIFGSQARGSLEFRFGVSPEVPIRSAFCCGEDFVSSAYPIGDTNGDGFDDFNLVVFQLFDSQPRDFTVFGGEDFDLGTQLQELLNLQGEQLPLSPSTPEVLQPFDFNGDGVDDSLLDARAIDIAFGDAGSPRLTGHVSPDGLIVVEGAGVEALGIEFSSEAGLLDVPTSSEPFQLILPGNSERVALGSLGNAVEFSAATTLPIRYRGNDPLADLTGRWGSPTGTSHSIDISFQCGGGRIAGDVNGDGEVGFGDFTILSHHFGQSEQIFAGGDLDCDGEVAFADFLVLTQNWGT